jgi:hypothetical protein
MAYHCAEGYMQGADDLVRRVNELERELRRTKRLLLLALVPLCVALVAWQLPTRATEVIHARGIVIHDEKGRDRIIIGAPVPDPREGKRISPSIGMVINDSAGYERFGLGLRANGSMGMGFDAPPGTGDPRNRERINIVADQHGGALIRMLDRETAIRARLSLDEQNRVALEFLNFPPGQVVSRRISIDGDSVTRRARQ